VIGRRGGERTHCHLEPLIGYREGFGYSCISSQEAQDALKALPRDWFYTLELFQRGAQQ
jgi:hypothetical protein